MHGFLFCVCLLFKLQVCLLRIGPPVVSHTEFSKLCCSSGNPLPFVSLACVDTVTVSRQSAVEGFPGRLPKAVVVTCGQNRGSVLHSASPYTPYISKLTIT